MRCTIETKYVESIRELASRESANGSRLTEGWVRIEAHPGEVVVRSTHGEASLPSDVTRQGVLFVAAAVLYRCLEYVPTRHWIEIDVSPKGVELNKSWVNLDQEEAVFFPNVNDAPVAL